MARPCFYSILLIGLKFAATVQAGYLCPESNGYFPDPDNCQIYYRCVDGGWDRHSCGPGTVFNPTHNTCDFPSRVKGCEHGIKNNPTSPPPEPTYPPTERTSAYPTTRYRPTIRTTEYPTTRYQTTQPPTSRYPETRYPPTREPPTPYPTTRYTQRFTSPRRTTPRRDYGKFHCTSDGYFGHPTYCDRFYRCVMTRPILFQCAPGTYFDDIIGTCNYKEQITECNEEGIKDGGGRPPYRPTRVPSHRPDRPQTGEPTHGWTSQGTTEWRTQDQTQWTSAIPSYSPAFSDYFTTTTAFPSTSSEIFICPNRCGFYPHPTRCDQFVICLDFDAKVHTCPAELYFNWQAKTCDYKENVNCYISNFENIYKKK